MVPVQPVLAIPVLLLLGTELQNGPCVCQSSDSIAAGQQVAVLFFLHQLVANTGYGDS